MNAEERARLIEEYGRGPDLLDEALSRISREAWEYKPAPEEWSVRQLLFHMADSEMMGVTRLNMIVTQPGTTMMSYDDEAWAQVLSYAGRSIEDALELFRLLRHGAHALLETLPESAFANSVIHPEHGYPEYGPDYNIEKWLRIYTRHMRDHTRQLQQNHNAWKLHTSRGGAR